MKVGSLVKHRQFFGSRTSIGTVLEVDDEHYVTVSWWDTTWVIPNPSMEKITDLVIICE